MLKAYKKYFKLTPGDEIAGKLRESGKTRVELADQLGVSKTVVDRCVNSVLDELSWKTLLTIAYALGVSLSSIVKTIPQEFQEYWDRLSGDKGENKSTQSRTFSKGRRCDRYIDLFRVTTPVILRNKIEVDGLKPAKIAETLGMGTTTVQRVCSPVWKRVEWRTIYYIAIYLGIDPVKTLLRHSVTELPEMTDFRHQIHKGLTPNTGSVGYAFWGRATIKDRKEMKSSKPSKKLVADKNPKIVSSTSKAKIINTKVNAILQELAELEKIDGITKIDYSIEVKAAEEGITYTTAKSIIN